MAVLRKLDRLHGDVELATWTPGVKSEEASAKAIFDKVMADEKPLAYKLDAAKTAGGGAQGTAIKEFDPSATEILFSPQHVGG